jgi:hypothetical protein
MQLLAETSSFILAMCVFSVTGQVPGIIPGFGISRAVASVVFLFLSSKVFSFHLILAARNPESGRVSTGKGSATCRNRIRSISMSLEINIHTLI